MLSVSAQVLGIDGARVDHLLGVVGLDRAAARKRVGQYSLGMRQRLGIAHALLGDPEVLILDEPANGLDPDGMRWMRGLLRDFAQRGGTVLLSSHLLHEIEAIADRLVIIAGGRIVAQGSRQDLLGGRSSTLARAADGAALRVALDAAGIEVTMTPDGGVLADADADRVGEAALLGGVALRELRADGDSSLEQLFFSLTAAGVASPSRIGGGGLMSAVALSHPAARRRPGFGRLVAVELRKMVDTRAGFWLSAGVVAATALVVLISILTGPPGVHDLGRR